MKQFIHRAEQATGHKGPAEIPPPGAPVNRFGGQEMIAKITSGKNPGFHPADGTDEHWLEPWRSISNFVGNSEGRHQVAAGATPGDENGTTQSRRPAPTRRPLAVPR